jgi:hypothetical protein
MYDIDTMLYAYVFVGCGMIFCSLLIIFSNYEVSLLSLSKSNGSNPGKVVENVSKSSKIH